MIQYFRKKTEWYIKKKFKVVYDNNDYNFVFGTVWVYFSNKYEILESNTGLFLNLVRWKCIELCSEYNKNKEIFFNELFDIVDIKNNSVPFVISDILTLKSINDDEKEFIGIMLYYLQIDKNNYRDIGYISPRKRISDIYNITQSGVDFRFKNICKKIRKEISLELL